MTTDTPSPARTPGFFARNALVLIVAGILVLTLVGAGVLSVSQRVAQGKQNDEIASLKGELQTATDKNNERIDKDVLSAMGVSRARMSTDEKIITQLVRTSLTWDSGASYMAARDTLAQDYSLSKDGQFFSSFMPASSFNLDENRNKVYYIDSAGMTSSMSGEPSVSVIKVRADVYTYAVIATASVSAKSVDAGSDQAQPSSTDRQVYYTMTINSKGEVRDLAGVSASGTQRQGNS